MNLFSSRLGLVAAGLLACTASIAHESDQLPSHRSCPQLDPLTIGQLVAVRQATARYRNLDNAVHDGYVDIGLFVPMMGHHYLRSDLLDGEFDPQSPELLVYADRPDGSRQLVAVEYAVPLELSADAPEGFFGDADEWAINNQFGLWTLHAWVWKRNPDGVFAAFNPRLP
ncbi:MAG: hypothetical protein R3E77_03380 [Steroidobacteraceae bacterium]